MATVRIQARANTMQPQQQTCPSSPPSPLYALAQEAFYRDVPEILNTHYRQWVAYHGNELIGFARPQTELYERCIHRGLKEDEFVVLFADHAALADQEQIDLPLNP